MTEREATINMEGVTYFTIEDWDTFYKEVLKRMPQNAEVQKYAPLVAALLVFADRIKPPRD